MYGEFDLAVRKELYSGLMECTSAQRRLFKLMYGQEDQTVKYIVSGMSHDKLSWAMEQVRRTLSGWPRGV